MAILIDLLVALTAAISAFIGHLVAHDVVEFTPKLSRAFIKRATAMLPNDLQSRYSEEWPRT